MERQFYSLQGNKPANVKKQLGISADLKKYLYPLTLRLARSLHWHLFVEGQRFLHLCMEVDAVSVCSQILISYGCVTRSQAAFMDFLIPDKTQVSFQPFPQQAITLDHFTLLPIFEACQTC